MYPFINITTPGPYLHCVNLTTCRSCIHPIRVNILKSGAVSYRALPIQAGRRAGGQGLHLVGN